MSDAASALRHPPSNLIGGRWLPIAGEALRTTNPADPARTVFACAPSVAHVDEAVRAARAALPAWSRTSRGRRFAVLRAFADLAKARAAPMADLICDEVGKALWECKGEAGLLAGKVDITLENSPNNAWTRVSDFELTLSASRAGACRFRPHGVMAVIGPFNFPAHLANGHIVPALALGNTVVFKPSDKAMAVGQALVELFDEALRACDLPAQGAGVINLVQGGADVAAALCAHPGLDAIALTGSWPVGRKVLEANLDHPGRLIALELGGNNPTIVLDDADLASAAIEITRCAFNTAGQRCTCTRRVIVQAGAAERLIPALVRAARGLVIAPPRASPCFSGPLISRAAVDAVLSFQERARSAGARVLLEARRLTDEWTRGGHYVSPGIVQVDRFSHQAQGNAGGKGGGFDPGADEEVFGPLLRVCVVQSLDEAIEQANATRYGLAAAIFTKNDAAAERFLSEVRAGCLNVNTGTAGASSRLPFGGLGLSGNHRPAGSFAVDYCAYPVATMIERGPTASVPEGMTFDAAWLDRPTKE